MSVPIATNTFTTLPSSEDVTTATTGAHGDAKAIEIAAMLGDSVVGVKHCMDPRAGKITPKTWGALAAGLACVAASLIAFAVSVNNAAYNKAALEYWTEVAKKPAHAYRPRTLSAGYDWIAFGGLVLGVGALAGALVRMRRERRSTSYRIGTAPGVEQPVEGAPAESFPLVAPSGDELVFNFAPGIDGEMLVDGRAVPLAELAASGRARPSAGVPGAFELPIPMHARIRAQVGQTAFLVSAVAKPRTHTAPLFAGLESRTLRYVAGSLAVHLGVVLLLARIPIDGGTAAIELALVEDTGIRARNAMSDDVAPEQVETDVGNGESEGAAVAAMALDEGAAGTTKSNRPDGHIRIKNNNVDPQVARTQAREAARFAGFLGSTALQSGDNFASLTSRGDRSSGFDDVNVYGPLFGAEGEGQGYFGYGRSGFGAGGGCDGGCGIIGTGNHYGHIGLGKLGRDGYAGIGGRGPRGRDRTPAVPRATIGQPTGSGDLDKAIVRRYIKRNVDKIAYCYEKELLARPGIAGTITVSFFISPSGSVTSSVGEGFDATIANCVAGVVGAIQFPRPSGGGGVQVNYPFTFHAAGQ